MAQFSQTQPQPIMTTYIPGDTVGQPPFPDPVYIPPSPPMPEPSPSYSPNRSDSLRLAELDCVARAVFDGDKMAAIRWLRDPYLTELAQMRFRGDIAAAWAWLEPTRHYVTTQLRPTSPEPDSETRQAPGAIEKTESKKLEENPLTDPGSLIDHRDRIEGLALILFGSDRATTLAWLLNARLTSLSRLLFDGDVNAASEWLIPLREYARGVVLEKFAGSRTSYRSRRASPTPEAESMGYLIGDEAGYRRRSPSPSKNEQRRPRSSSFVRVSLRPTSTVPPTAAMMMKEARDDMPSQGRLSHIRGGPSDSWVPTVDDRGFIDLPPPHELQSRTPTTGTSPPNTGVAPPPIRMTTRAPSQAANASNTSLTSPPMQGDRRHRTSRAALEQSAMEAASKMTAMTEATAARGTPTSNQQSPPPRRRPQHEQNSSITSSSKTLEKKSETWYRR